MSALSDPGAQSFTVVDESKRTETEARLLLSGGQVETPVPRPEDRRRRAR